MPGLQGIEYRVELAAHVEFGCICVGRAQFQPSEGHMSADPTGSLLIDLLGGEMPVVLATSIMNEGVVCVEAELVRTPLPGEMRLDSLP